MVQINISFWKFQFGPHEVWAHWGGGVQGGVAPFLLLSAVLIHPWAALPHLPPGLPGLQGRTPQHQSNRGTPPSKPSGCPPGVDIVGGGGPSPPPPPPDDDYDYDSPV